MIDYVTVDDLAAVLGMQLDSTRATTAVDAANQLIEHWCPPQLGVDPPTEATPAQHQAGLELAQTLYRRQAATGALTDPADVLAQLPADVVGPIRDLLDADSHQWGLA